MEECTREDLCELLMRALSPDDRPEEVPGLMDHARECARCAEELKMHANFHHFLRDHRAELAAAVSACPETEALVRFVMKGSPDPEVETHLAHCRPCAEQAKLVAELERTVLDSADAPTRPTAAQWGAVRSAVAREYGRPPEAKPTLWQRVLAGVIEALHVPSLAAGAVAAALVLLVVLPHTGSLREPAFTVALSDSPWEASGMIKHPNMKPVSTRKAAVLILQGPANGLAPEQIDKIYGSLNLADAVSSDVEFISPPTLKEKLADSATGVRSVEQLRQLVRDRTDAQYLLIFQINAGRESKSLTAALMDRGHAEPLGTIRQTGISISAERLPDRMKSMTGDLFSQVNPDGKWGAR
ncbi:MAG: hypothetical protein AB1646_01760 [Thermodesulfobacteriota bacterium]